MLWAFQHEHTGTLATVGKTSAQDLSPVNWQYFNLHGEFDSSDEAPKDSLRFDLDALFAFQ